MQTPVDCEDRDAVYEWVEDVRKIFDEIEKIIRQQRERIRERFVTELAKHEPSLADQVRNLEQCDGEVEELLGIVKSQLIVLGMHTTTKTEPRLEHVVSDDDEVFALQMRGGELIEWIREQEASLTAWFVESFPAAE